MGKPETTTKPAPAPVNAAAKTRQKYNIRHADDAERLFNLGLISDKEIERLCQVGLLAPTGDKLDQLRARGLKVDIVRSSDNEVESEVEPDEVTA